MYLPLILFFVSLAGIVVMVSRKLVVVRNNQTMNMQHSHPFVEEIQKIKHLTFKSSKKIGYVVIFVTLRFFIKSSNLVKTKSKVFVKELQNKFKKNTNSPSGETIEKKESSNYLKVISEYRQKIRKIKHIIKKEEGIE